MTQEEKAQQFLALHRGPQVLVLPNAWDVASARILESAGFPAIATTSAGIAYARGYRDGELIGRDEMLEEVGRIARSVAVPVTADLEAGYGKTPEEVAETIRRAIAAGAVGANLEDYTQDSDDPLYPLDDAVARIRAAREACDAAGITFVLNARTDTYLSASHKLTDPFAETLRRLTAYRAAGARCLYAPAFSDIVRLGELVEALGAPLNLLAGGHTPPVARLQDLGVARVSAGSGLMRAAYGQAQRAAAELRDSGTYGYAAGAIGFADFERLLGERPAELAGVAGQF